MLMNDEPYNSNPFASWADINLEKYEESNSSNEYDGRWIL